MTTLRPDRGGAARRLSLAGLPAVLTLAMVVGCAPETTPVAAPSPTPSPTSSVSTFTPAPEPAATVVAAPLRGTEMPIEAAVRPSLAAKIDNVGEARPQFGLDRADIVYEELVEGGLTRYVAVWHSDVPDEVGPIRSIRPMDPDIVSPLGGLIAYSGGRAEFIALMKDAPVHNSVHGGLDDAFMARTGTRPAPHNVLLRATDLVSAYAHLNPPKPQFAYSPSGWAPVFGRPSTGLDLQFSDVSARSWRWDAAAGAYLRAQDGRADETADGDPVTATNVVVLRVGIDTRYGDVPKTVLVGEGRGSVSTGGSAMEITWQKDDRDSPIVLRNDAGSEVKLAPGSTWVELVPTAGSATVR